MRRQQDEEAAGPFSRIHQYQSLGPNANRLPFLGTQVEQNRPAKVRSETYCEMLHLVFCPHYKALSLTTFILVVNTVLFVMSVKGGIVKEGSLLQVQEPVLIRWGAMVPHSVKYGYQFQLIVTSLFLSFDFMQYLFNTICIIILVSTIEHSIGALSTAVVYFGGGVLGSLFGAMVHCCTEQPYVETHAAIYAMLGCLLGIFILNWDALSNLEELRCFMLCILSMFTFMILIFTFSGTSSSSSVDKVGIIGGMMGGFFLTLAAAPPVREGRSYEGKCRIFGWTFAGIQALTTLLMLMLVYE